MRERFAQIETPDGRMEAFVTHPKDGGPFPAVIIYMDVFGLREELFDIARRIGTVGYYVIVPDFYYREGRVRVSLPEKSRGWGLATLGPEVEKKVRAAGAALTNGMVVRDTEAALKFLSGERVKQAKGAIGFCMGGRHAICAAGHFPDDFQATASLHGSTLVSEAADSPHLLANKFRGEIYCGFPEDDPLAPTSTIQTLAEVLGHAPVEYRYERHKNAIHGYALPDRDVHHKQAANRDWEMIFAMFRRQIPAE
ncbi:MAG TPA: dienelactone hydrolase family protein [Xanthobacteraceae bacterium]|jgi:carboxymethylenebutenolidase|nr:dienelactone hydrolase family protein [Xanthobacteraceae bacterium]